MGYRQYQRLLDDVVNLYKYPEFDLEWRYDDEETPEEVTLFPQTHHRLTYTEWITAATEDVVDVTDAR